MNALFAHTPAPQTQAQAQTQAPIGAAIWGEAPQAASRKPSSFAGAPFAQPSRAPQIIPSGLRSDPAARPSARFENAQPGVLSDLGARHRALINSIAAHQFRYGRIEEALALLQLSLRYGPEDVSTLRLLAQVLSATGDWAAVEQILDAIDRLGAPADQRSYFLRMLTTLRRNGLAAAQRLFRAYVSAVSGI